MAVYECAVCSYLYDEEQEKVAWEDLPDDWVCPVCGAPKSEFAPVRKGEDSERRDEAGSAAGGEYLGEWRRLSDDVETHMADIHAMAAEGTSLITPMRSQLKPIGWEEILIRGAQLARLPLNEDMPVSTRTVIGPRARRPLVIESPVYVSHMSFGALSREAKLALARGSARVKTAMCSGEGGILPESLESAYKYIFEYVPRKYSVNEPYLQRVDAIEIKIGQSAKPGMGGHLPGTKVTGEIAEVRGVKEGADITSPARFDDIRNGEELRKTVAWLRDASGGAPVGIKLAAGHIEADLEVALVAEPDFITLDGRAGATGAAPKSVKDATSVPTVFALYRARRFLRQKKAEDVTLVVTGGLRVSSDCAKALALGADAVALATAALIACGCQQYRICHTGKCPVGVTSQDPALRARLDVEESAGRVANFLRVVKEELEDFARLTGKDNVHDLAPDDLCTTSSEISNHTDIEHV
jgi:glutamate synthase domain-containing protein 2/rubredoxin